jgi:prepilin signal peptidase PulO-like enzyme (type II secretory pathway)
VPRQFRPLLAALLAPVMLLFLFIATAPADQGITPRVVLLAYALAHLLFWSAFLVTKLAARRLHTRSLPQLATLMGFVALLITSMFAAVPFLIFSHTYNWHAAVRDELSLAVAAAGSLVLYGAVRGPHKGPPNQRLERP